MSGTAWRRLAQACVAALLAALATAAAQRPNLRLEAGSATWRRVVRGVTAKGLLTGAGGLLLPGLSRASVGQVCVQAANAADAAPEVDAAVGREQGAPVRSASGANARGGQAPSLALRVDAGPPIVLPVGAAAWHCILLPASALPGLRLDFAARDGAVRLVALDVRPGPPSPLWALVAALLAASLVLARPTGGLGLGLAAGGLVAAAAWLPLGAWLWPQALPALLPAWVAAAGGLALAWRRAGRRALADVALVAAFVGGAALRLAFLHSTGSWDTEYWKAWMQRSVEMGVSRVYGPPEALPAGHALAQLRGREELWKVERGGRAFVVDYPPLAMALWVASWRAVNWAAPELPLFERENVAVKLPALLGDVASLVALLWACAPDRRRALVLGALYWALPVSWLSSATLGYFDGSLPPLLLIALVQAARGRAGTAGAWLALAALIKPTALIAAPACAVALWRGAGPEAKRALARAMLAGLAVALLVATPFVVAGTFETMLVHCARLFFQERLSGGYPNPWWLLGHVLTAGASGSWLGPVAFAPVTLVPFPVRPLGSVAFALGALWLCRRQASGARDACRTGALLFLLYGMVGIGVHENHPHPLFLLLLYGGLRDTRARLGALGAALVYVGDMLALSGLGRFHGPRYLWLLSGAERVAAWRMALGIDLTLILALIHFAAGALLLYRTRPAPSRARLAADEGERA